MRWECGNGAEACRLGEIAEASLFGHGDVGEGTAVEHDEREGGREWDEGGVEAELLCEVRARWRTRRETKASRW